MKISLPSIRTVATRASAAATRFPLVLLAALVAAVAAMALVGSTELEEIWWRTLAVAMLGLPLLFAAATLVELRALRGLRAVAPPLVALLALGGVALAWPGWTPSARLLHFALLSVVCHLAASFLAYVGRPHENGFWQFNRVLFLRFLTAALYVVVLFAGLAGALAAIDVLFSAGIDNIVYPRLFFADALLFGTWFFVAGIPRPLTSLDARTDYPDGLRTFTQFVLIPLVVLYLAILTAYMGKVVITRVWPSGWIGYLVSYVTVAGILAWLLVRPLEARAEYVWVRTFSRGFFVAMLPSIVMLWMALAKRIGQYGFTERRYLAVMGAFWLSGVALFYILSRSRNIAWVPITLCLVTCVSAVGPLSAFTVSRHDQKRRLQHVFERNGLWRDGHVVTATGTIPASDQIAISEGLRYLWGAHGAHVIDAWLPDSLRPIDVLPRSAAYGILPDAEQPDRQASRLMAQLGMEFQRAVPVRRSRPGGSTTERFDFTSNTGEAFDVRGFAMATSLWLNGGDAMLTLSEPPLVIRVVRDGDALWIMRDSAVVGTLSADSIALAARRVDSVNRASPAGAEAARSAVRQPVRPLLVFDVSAGSQRVRFLFNNVTVGRRPDGHWRVSTLGGHVLVGPVP